MVQLNYAGPMGDRPQDQGPPGVQTNPPGWPTQAEADLAVQHGWSGGYMGGPGNHRRKSKTWLWVLLAVLGTVVVTIVGLAALGAASQDETPTSGFTSMPVQAPAGEQKSTAATPKKAAAPGLGAVVKIEDLNYQVHAVKTGIRQVGPKDFGATAQGSFTRIDISVTNVGNDPKLWDADYNVKAKDSQGREFSVDSSAGIFGNAGNDGWLEEINPGNTVRAYVFFDLPKGAKLTSLKLSSGMFGDDVTVKL